ncbi:hypothetical protein F2Q69_00028650 [Brassica cretica]|uniref:Uncharacterized protein n=1 Tax=Brassica cretica TaxID=69181 RepID=A0A8S9S6G0_BRACR|nr:hypothetical protein F2Q69_00028650 [Brassica cretica]
MANPFIMLAVLKYGRCSASQKLPNDKEFESRSNQAERNHLRWSFAERLLCQIPRRCVNVALTDLDGVEDRLFQQQLFRRFQNLEPCSACAAVKILSLASVCAAVFFLSLLPMQTLLLNLQTLASLFSANQKHLEPMLKIPSLICCDSMARPGGDAAFLGSDSQFSCGL